MSAMNAEDRRLWRSRLAQLWTAAPDDAVVRRLLAPDAEFLVAAPIDPCIGPTDIASRVIAPMQQALRPMLRRDDLFLAGESTTGSGTWLGCMGHYVGQFVAPLFGIAPLGHLVFLRFGEFYRVADGRIVQARILLDLLDLLRQCGRMPLPHMLGTEMLFPAPATHDGIRTAPSPESDASLHLVERMLTALGPYDPKTFESAAQTGADGTWHQDMLWYGPGGIGSSITYEGFQQDHRIAFLTGFPDRKGGNHYARFGDGPYVCSGGWPSITATHAGDYLGVKATGRAITMRVMDFWRCQAGRIMENWVFIDMPDLLGQLGVDVFAGG